MYIVYDETENHNNSKVHAIVRMANFKVLRNLVSESLYEVVSFYSFLGTRILSNYSKAYFASLLSLRYSSRAQGHYGGLSVSFGLPPARPTFIGYLLLAYSFIDFIYMYSCTSVMFVADIFINFRERLLPEEGVAAMT